ncbi:MAG TPA: ABC transporter ATP-binding protein [Gemmatimonadaceae bacterium]|jgi:ABC-type polysaccharide/polyol phosphate transport system ATPase subunit|nr:ABC transporter ATP-binding protein [Gemmatimonadaceae bacterium]
MQDLVFQQVSKRYLVKREIDGDANKHPWIRKLNALRRRKELFWALRDVNFTVERGETVGIIGHNGAGKSTILKLLANITSPSDGQITINGRLSALIEVGSGFHPELTGRENIFLNGAILGMRRAEISEKLDSIVDFAGVRPFLDVPVKRFSSGMYVRLGFSIASHLDPDILLLDEVLAVGDAAFQEKCLSRIEALRRGGTTIVFISHDLAAVERICDRVILLRRGEVAATGSARDVITEYQQQIEPSRINTMKTAVEDDRVVISSLTFRAPDGTRPAVFHSGDPLVAHIEFDAHEPVKDAVFEVFVRTGDLTELCQLTTETSGEPIDLPRGPGTLRFDCRELALQPGMYHANVCVKERMAPEAINWQYHAATLRVDPGKVTRGQFYQANSWNLALAAKGPPVAAAASGAAASQDASHRQSLAPSS